MALALRPRIRHQLDPGTYIDKTFANLGGSIVSQLEVSSIEAKLDSSYETILEVGIGPGRITQALLKRDAYVVGIDLDPNMVRHVAGETRSKSNFDLVVADGQVLPFRAGIFDVVVCIRVLKYLKTPEKGLSEFGAVLRTRGKLILDFPNLWGLSGIFQSVKQFAADEIFPRLFKRSSIEREIEEIGLRVLAANPLLKIPPVVWTHIRKKTLVRALITLESILQRITHPEVITNSTIVLAEKTDFRHLMKSKKLDKPSLSSRYLKG